MAAFLLEYDQYAIGVPAGMSILLGSLQLLIQDFINLDNAAEGTTAKRAAISMDLTSMFNALNLDVFFDECDKEEALRKYIPYFETCFTEATTYVLQKSDGSAAYVTQEQGGAQGSNLLPMMAAILLRRLIKSFLEEKHPLHLTPPTSESINKIIIPMTNERGDPRQQCDVQVDTAAIESFKSQHANFVATGGSPILSYMDDMSSVPSYSYLMAFARFLAEKGYMVGAYVNWIKTQILLGLNWDAEWRDQNKDGSIRTGVNIVDALIELGVPRENIIIEEEDGPTSLAKIKGIVKVLGSAIGYKKGIDKFRQKVLSKQQESFAAIMNHVPDNMFKYILTTMCILPTTMHMFATAPNREGIEKFAGECDDYHKRYFERLFMDGESLDSETAVSYRLATLLVRQGGINFTSPKNINLAAYLATWARVLTAGKRNGNSKEPTKLNGIRASNGEKIGEHHQAVQHIIDREMLKATLTCVKDFNDIARELCEKYKTIEEDIAESNGAEGIINKGAVPKLQHIISAALTANEAQNIYRELSEKEVETGVKSHLRKIMPSSTQALFSEFLSSLNTSDKVKLSSEAFMIAIRLKLGLPIIKNVKIGDRRKCPLCAEVEAVDRFGEHAFSCPSTLSPRTTAMHNTTRDELARALGRLSAIGSPVAQFAKVCIEIRGLVPGTALRPADIHISLMAPVSIFDPLGKKIDDIKSVAFDITITNITAQHAIEGFENEAVWPPAAYTHILQAEERKRAYKHNGSTPSGTAAFLAERHTAFVPIAIDPYGGMGSAAAAFLFGSLAQRKRANMMKGFSPDDCTAAKWITPGGKPSENVGDYIAPFMPKEICCQLKAASKEIKKNTEDETGHIMKNYWESSAEREITQSLSLNHVNGAAAVVEFFITAASEGGEGSALPDRTDFGKIREKFLAAAERMRNGAPAAQAKSKPPKQQSPSSGKEPNAAAHVPRASESGSDVNQESNKKEDETTKRSDEEERASSSSHNQDGDAGDGDVFEDCMDRVIESQITDQEREGEGAGSQQSHRVRRSLSGGGPESLSQTQKQQTHFN
jgi:hypothetical protein